MKKSLKSIAKSMELIVAYQKLSTIKWETSLVTQRENLVINKEQLSHSRAANRIMMKRFELEHTPFVSVLEGLLELIPADLGKQGVVEEAKRLIGLMKVK